MNSNNETRRFCIYFRLRRKFPTTSVHTHCIMPPSSTRDARLNSPSAPSSRSPIPYRTRSPDVFGSVWVSAPFARPSAEERCAKTDFLPQKGSRTRGPKNEKAREAQKNGNEPSHDETFPHRTYIEMKKLSRNLVVNVTTSTTMVGAVSLTPRKYGQKSNRPNIYPIFFIQIVNDFATF